MFTRISCFKIWIRVLRKKNEIPREIAKCHDIFPETNYITLILRSAIYTREKSNAWVVISLILIWPLAKDGIRKKIEIHIMDKIFHTFDNVSSKPGTFLLFSGS